MKASWAPQSTDVSWLGHKVLLECDCTYALSIFKQLTQHFYRFGSDHSASAKIAIVYRTPSWRNDGSVLPNSKYRLPFCFGDFLDEYLRQDGSLVYHQASRSRWFSFEDDSVYVWCSHKTNDDLMLPVRLVRELLNHLVVTQGAIKLHGAAVSTPEAGITIIGPSGSGKTSLLLMLLGRPFTKLVGGDRILVQSSGQKLVTYGTPIPSQIGEKLVNCYLGDQVPPALFNGVQRRDPFCGPFLKHSFPPQTIADALGVQLLSRCNVDMVLVPDLRPLESNGVKITPIDDGEKHKILDTEDISNDPSFPAQMIGKRPQTSSPTTREKIVNLTWLRVSAHYLNRGVLSLLGSRIGEFTR